MPEDDVATVPRARHDALVPTRKQSFRWSLDGVLIDPGLPADPEVSKECEFSVKDYQTRVALRSVSPEGREVWPEKSWTVNHEPPLAELLTYGRMDGLHRSLRPEMRDAALQL